MRRSLIAMAVLAVAGSDPAAAVCSVFDRHPCAPVCSVFDNRPCAPDYPAPIGQDLRLTIETSKVAGLPGPAHELDTIRDLFDALRACWQAPAERRAGMEMSVRLSFRRTGEAIATPRITYATPGVPERMREIYHDAIRAALTRCTPLPLSQGLGGAIAGRPIAIRYVDDH